MVVLAIMAAIALAAVPFTASWIDSSRVVQARAVLQQGFTQARAVALRNGAGAIGDTPAALLCVSDNTVYVHAGMPGSCSSGAVWRHAVPGGSDTSVLLGAETSPCIAMANTGRILNGISFDGANCTTSIAYQISRGTEEVSGDLL